MRESAQVKAFEQQLAARVKITRKLCESVAQKINWPRTATQVLSDPSSIILLTVDYSQKLGPLMAKYKQHCWENTNNKFFHSGMNTFNELYRCGKNIYAIVHHF